tara:strand:- start:17 stop:655 length:639 start_codon:yes stop_codon:yes gene_type:complete
MEYDYLYKIILLGDSGSGKTSIMNKYIDKKTCRQPYQPTIGVDFRLKLEKNINDKTIKLHIWDTAGQESFRSIIRSYYKDIAAAIIVFDITNYKSFQNVKYWLNEIVENSDTNIKSPILIIGNKIDLDEDRTVPLSEAEKFAKENKLFYAETSSHTEGTNVDDIMLSFLTSITEHYINRNIKSNGVIRPINIVSDTHSDPCGRNVLDCCRPS